MAISLQLVHRERHHQKGSQSRQQRNCGACTVCCTSLTVHELNKPAGVPCKHLTAQGCGIYPVNDLDLDQRPDICREFDCGWKLYSSLLTPKLRPDRAGFLFYPQPASKPTMLVLFKNVVGTINSIALRKVRQLSKGWSLPIRWSHQGEENVPR